MGSVAHPFLGWGCACPYLVQRLLQHALRGLPPALGHVAGCLPTEQQQGGRTLVSHLLEDVVGVLQLLTTLRGQSTSPLCHPAARPYPACSLLEGSQHFVETIPVQPAHGRQSLDTAPFPEETLVQLVL